MLVFEKRLVWDWAARAGGRAADNDNWWRERRRVLIEDRE